MRYLAIDLGAKRTGLAVGDDATRIVTPLEIITTTSGPRTPPADRTGHYRPTHPMPWWSVFRCTCTTRRPPPPNWCKPLPRNSAGASTCRCNLMDERLTSYAADQQMNQTGLTHKGKKARRDALAAAAILRDFLAQHGRGGA